jgi:16S rRNA (guanine966-N2)-methyltransferase
MRERAFAVLGQRITGARFLDLFAGTGAVGIEALSRGARSVVFVERNRSSARLIEQNSASFDLGPDRARLIIRPAIAAVRELAKHGDRFHIAWADPPFEDWSEGLETVVELFEAHLLEADGLACLECPEKADVAGALPPHLEIVRDLAGGASRVVMIGPSAPLPILRANCSAEGAGLVEQFAGRR